MEHVYLVRVLNVASKDIIDEEQQAELCTEYSTHVQKVADDISKFVFDNYCNEKTDGVDVEVMKVAPLEYEDLVEVYG